MAGSKSGCFDDMLGAVGHSMMKVRKDESVQVGLPGLLYSRHDVYSSTLALAPWVSEKL